MEKHFHVGIAKLPDVDKIMDKPWKTKNQVYHNLPTIYAHNHHQAFPNMKALYHKLHNYDYYLFDAMLKRNKGKNPL